MFTYQMRRGLASKCCLLGVMPVSCTFPTPSSRPATPPTARSTGPDRHAASGIMEPNMLKARVASVAPIPISQSTAPSSVRTRRLLDDSHSRSTDPR